MLTGAQLFAKNSKIFVDDEAGAGKEAYANRVTLSDAEDSDNDDEQRAGRHSEAKKQTTAAEPAAPAAPSAAAASSVMLQGKQIEVGDASLYLDGDDDDLDDLDLHD